MRIGLIGAVSTTKVALEAFIRHEMDIALVMGYEPANPANVSAYTDISTLAQSHGLPYIGFKKINDHAQTIQEAELDVLFVVGLSQLVSNDIINAPAVGAVGFHSTALPRGRGRAPIAWMVINKEGGAATFFLLDEEADAGPILVQELFDVDDEDDASSVELKILHATQVALDQWLPQLKQGVWEPKPQDTQRVTEYGVRKPDDGLIDFTDTVANVDRLIKATTSPHPGAFTYFKHNPFIILKSRIEKHIKIQGAVGRVLKVEGNELLVQCGDGIIWLTPAAPVKGLMPRVGERLGYLSQYEIHHIYQELALIKEKLGITDE